MHFGALGDIHGDFESARRIMRRHPGVPFWVCVGDVADDRGRYEPLPAPLYWIKGNNENFDAIERSGHEALTHSGNLHFIPNGQLIEIAVGRPFTGAVESAAGQSFTGALESSVGQPFTGALDSSAGQSFMGWRLRVAGLGGTFAPTWYDTPAADLPHPKKRTAKATELADKRRHFVREEVEACKAMRGVDLFMSHEAPRPFRVGRVDAGKTPINEVLAAMRPRLHLFGHHHRFAEQERQGIRTVGLALAGESYLLVDANTLEYQRLPALE